MLKSMFTCLFVIWLFTGSGGASSSPMLAGDSPLAGWSAATAAFQSALTHPNPPPLPGDTNDQPKPPPLPDPSTIQEKPKPPPLPRSREASPPPLPPSNIPERKRTSSISSTPSLDSVSSDPLSIESDEERPKPSVEKTPPAKPAPTTTTPGKGTPGQGVTKKKRISIVKKVVVRRADGTKVVRVIRMDPTKATAKKLLMKATARKAGDQGESPKQVTPPGKASNATTPTDDSKKDLTDEAGTSKAMKQLSYNPPESGAMGAQLGKRKHFPAMAGASEMQSTASHLKEEQMSSGEEGQWSATDEKSKEQLKSVKDGLSVAQASSDSEKDITSPMWIPMDEDSPSRDLEDVSSPGSAMDSQDDTSRDYQPDKDDEKEDFPDNVSESDSHISDVTVSSVHTSDLSSFDERISSSSSSSSSEESAGEDTDDYGIKEGGFHVSKCMIMMRMLNYYINLCFLNDYDFLILKH